MPPSNEELEAQLKRVRVLEARLEKAGIAPADLAALAWLGIADAVALTFREILTEQVAPLVEEVKARLGEMQSGQVEYAKNAIEAVRPLLELSVKSRVLNEIEQEAVKRVVGQLQAKLKRIG